MNLEYERLLKEFLDAEDKWLRWESTWLDDHHPVRNAHSDESLDVIYRNVKFRAGELRATAKKLGADYEKHAEYHLGKNFGLPHGT